MKPETGFMRLLFMILIGHQGRVTLYSHQVYDVKKLISCTFKIISPF